MMGKDCERIVQGINGIHTELKNVLKSLRGMANQPMQMERFTVNYSEGSSESFEVKEKEITVPGDLLSSIVSAKGKLEKDFSNMAVLKSKLYTDPSSFNNSNGSPWTELNQLQEDLEDIETFASGGMKYKSSIVALMPMIGAAMTSAAKAESAMMLYHDYVQRGYDAVFNGKTASITFKRDKNHQSTGNIDQVFSENVNIEQESLDPY